MPITVIKEGDKDKQGNMVCPNCGERVLVTHHLGDPLKCPKCDTPYQHVPKQNTWV